ncbi:MAG: DNA repair protein RecO [Spirochaetales bacterium]|nr:DNA repair protein RecO [Spirochaetales bacterium]
MSRNYCTEAAVLKTRRMGDIHKTVIILSPEKGILNAVVHGAYKGKSRISSITDPFCLSVFELYHNPVKDLWKITGCESRELNSNIRENLNAVYNASFWSELILKSHASGADFEWAYSILCSALSSLNAAPDDGMMITMHFLYRFLIGSGFISDFSSCGHCGRERGNAEVYFSPVEGCFLCSLCASSGLPVIDGSSASYLEASLSLNLEEAVKNRLDLRIVKEIRNLLLAIIKSIIEVPLKTLDYIDYVME